MIKTSPVYQQLFKEGAIQEYRVKIGDVVYGHDAIKDAPSLQENLLDKSTFTVGSFTISVLKLKLKVPSEEIPHNASVVFSYRYNNGDLQSEWVDKFNGRITKRTKYTDEVTSIEAKDRASNYDVFLDYFGDEFEKYPANTRKVAQLCANHLGLTIENLNDVIDLDIVEYPNELTMVEMLKNIARNSGGNWVIVGDKLRLVTKGKNYHTFIKFADDDQGNGMSENEDGKEYYGIYYGLNDSSNKDDYAWYEMPSDRNYLLNSGVRVDFEEQDVIPTTVEEYLPTVGGRNLYLGSEGGFIIEPRNTGTAVDNFNYYTMRASRMSRFEVGETYTLSGEAEITDGEFDKITVYEGYPGGITYQVPLVNGKFSHTFELKSKEADRILIYAGIAGKTRGNGMILRKLKLEAGDITTDWTPAPEDFNNLKGKSYALSQPLQKENILSLNGSFEEDDFVGLWLGDDKFIGFLDNQELTFDLGGRNYIRDEYKRNWAELIGTPDKIGEDYKWKSVIAPVEPNTTYTISRTDNTNNRFRLFWLDEVPKVGSFINRIVDLDNKLSHTFVTPNEATWLFVYLSSDSASWENIPNIKLEKGDTPTPWTPAPEDFNSPEFVVVKTLSEKGAINNAKLEKGSIATDWTPAISETKVDYPAQSIETSSLLNPISKILMYYADEKAFESGDGTGSTLEIDSPWGTQESANYVHSVLNGYEYVPIKVNGAYIDPAIELGDIVSIDGHDVLVANVRWLFDGITTAEIEVPINNEINYDDPYNTLVNNQFKRKVSLGDAYQGVTISRDKGIEMLVSHDGTEENATGRYYADLYRGIAFQTRDNKNQDWHDWMYFDLDENMFKLSLYETKEITDGKFTSLTNKYNNLVMTVDGLSSEIAQIQGGNIISNFIGELGLFDWEFEADPLYPRNDLYPNNKLHPRDRNGAIMRVVETDTAAGTGFELFAIGKAISQYAIVEGGADYSLYTRTKGANGVRFILREYSSATGTGSYQETVLANAVSSNNWTTLNHTLTIKPHVQSVRIVVEKTNYNETIFTNSSFNFGNPRPYTQSIADVNAKAEYAKALSEQTAEGFAQTVQLVETLDGRVTSSESKLTQNANEISTKVSKNKVISEINQSAETVGIKANKVELEGYTSINKHFKVLPNGDVEFTNATGNNMTITGNLTAGRIAGLNFNNNIITFPNGKLRLNSNTNSIDFGSGLQMEHSTFSTDLAVYDVAYFKSPSTNSGVKIGVEYGAGGRPMPFVMTQGIYTTTSQYPLILNGVYGDVAYKGKILYIDSNGYVRAK